MGIFQPLLNWIMPESTFMRAEDDQVREALTNDEDTGNAIFDAWLKLLIEEDGYDIELALMGIPESKEKDLSFYMDRLREIYVQNALLEIGVVDRQVDFT